VALVLIAATVAISGWTAFSWFWSSEPSTSLDEAVRAPVYVAAAVVFVACAAAGGSLGLLLGVSAGATALAGYSLIDRYLSGSTPALLSGPLGYANALGALCAIGLVVVGTLGVAAGRRPGPAGIAAASAIVLVVALALTGSRGSWLALAAGIGVAVAARRGGRRWAVAAVSVVAGLEGALFVLTAFGTPKALQARGDYWHVAWHVGLHHPVAGWGAGTFDLAWGAYGDLGRWGAVADAHSLYLETFAELGVIGLVLLAGLVAPVVVTASRSTLSAIEVAALGGAVTFLVHAGLDFDWEMPAVTVAGIACLAATAGGLAARPAGVRLRSTLFGVDAAAILGYFAYLVLHRF
jgi:hypothetical protein